jgi:hypothetical protein
MTWSALTVVHITGGGLAIASGFVALFARKGALLHRTAGNVFFVAMLAMSGAAAYLAVSKLEHLMGLLTFYFVTTAWATVIRKEGTIGGFETAALLVAAWVAASFLATGLGLVAVKDKYPAQMYVIFGSLATLASLMDASVLLRGGLSGAQRIARHLWRMTFAMFVATGSYFLGQPKFVPAILRETQLNFVPVVVVAVLLVYWLARVLFTRWYAKAAPDHSGGAVHQSA